MKKLPWIGCIVVASLAATPRAHAWDYPPYRVQGGVKCYVRIEVGNANLPLAPWYLYFPYDPCLRPVPPIVAYPNYAPRPMPPAAAFGYPPPTMMPPAPFPVPATPPAAIQRTGYQPVSYQAPAYWYGQ